MRQQTLLQWHDSCARPKRKNHFGAGDALMHNRLIGEIESKGKSKRLKCNFMKFQLIWRSHYSPTNAARDSAFDTAAVEYMIQIYAFTLMTDECSFQLYKLYMYTIHTSKFS